MLFRSISSQDFAPKGQPIRTWKPDLDVKPNQPQRVEFSLKDEGGDPLPIGYYFLGLKASPFSRGSSASNFLQAAPIVVASDNLTFKSTESESLVWLTDLETGKPVKNVDVLFYDADGKKIGNASTDKDGLAYADGLAHPYFARTDDKNHLAFAAQFWGSEIGRAHV